jgi:simple sugar transport system substrate-binding protein
MDRSARGWLRLLVPLLAVLALVAAACSSDEGGDGGASTSGSPSGGKIGEGFTFGMILVGPQNDHGWSQANYEAGKYVEEQLGATMIVIDKVNPSDRPETSVDQVAADMIDQGAQMVFATSDDMKDGIETAAAEHPDVPMVWTSGDSAWAEGKDYKPDLTNLANIMGRMEYGKMMAGCAAALTTQTGKIGFLGPLINDETRRLANSAYLGAKYCWENYRNEDPAKLQFSVNWIGFWFNIPGVTLDPTQVTNDFFDSGHDVVISGIDTTEALVRAGQRAAAGEKVWAIPYDFKGACDEAPDVCLGVPYFNWGPAYTKIVTAAIDGSFSNTFEWNPPDWADINNPDTSAIGFEKGTALSSDASATLDTFIAGLGDGSIDLYVGPINWQDGTPFLADGETATDLQIWYQGQLLEGMEGASSA